MKCTSCSKSIRERKPFMKDDILGDVYLCGCCDDDIAQTMGVLDNKREKIKYNYRKVECCLTCKHANDSVLNHECNIIDDVDFSTVCDLFEWEEQDE